MNTLRIAVIGAKGLPAKQGGIEHYCQELYPRIRQRGYVIDLYARYSYTSSSKLSPNYYQSVKIIPLPSIPFKGFDALFNSILATIIATFKKYDIIHVHALGPSLWCWIGKLFSTSKIVVTCHGLDWQRAKWGRLASALIRLGEWMSVKWADEIIVVSQDLKTYFQQTHNRCVHYIPTAPSSYAISDSKFVFLKSLSLESKKYILFLGRLVPEKRPDLLIKAFKLLEADEWKLVLVGASSDSNDYFLKLKQEAGNFSNICFIGELQGELLSEIMRGAGLFVLPSDLEGLPLALLEAMKEGIPVIASDIPPHKQLLGKNRGLLFKKGNIQSCLSCLKTAINCPEQMLENSQKAQAYVNEIHDWDKITETHVSLYLPKRWQQANEKQLSEINWSNQ